MAGTIRILRRMPKKIGRKDSIVWNEDVATILRKLPNKEMFDFVITSPPYNIGKSYEKRLSLKEYVDWHARIIREIVARTKRTGSICWQVGNYVENGAIAPLDYLFHPILTKLGLKLRNRIVWQYGHGHHEKRRFSGRYEVVLWYTKSDEYHFDLDAVRVPPKYPGKRAYRGPRNGKLSGNPLGKNPEDVWEVNNSAADIWNIPNVKASHVEKTEHPCQFPVGLVERLVLALTKKNDLIFDPYAGTGSAGVAALIHGRRFWGCEIDKKYARGMFERLNRTTRGSERFRSHARPLYDHRTSKLSILPQE
jgi:adenine-specific DNA-methyltransferase